MERDLARVALFAALIAALGLLPPLTLAFGVPITAQSMGVMLCGTILGARKGALAVLVFLALVLMGLPLLAGGRGGLGVFAGPSFGFLIGWPLAALVTGWVASSLRDLATVWAAGFASVVGGIWVMYAFGIAGLAWRAELSLTEASVAVASFVPGDLAKAVLTGLVTSAIAKVRPNMVETR